jgi:drug/metabolite transporter (DMT)-like permease
MLAIIAALGYAIQAVGIEVGLDAWSRVTERTSPFTAAFINIIVATTLFWLLFAIWGDVPSWTVAELVPFVAAGILNPAVFQLLYFRGINTVGASVSAALVAGNPAVAALVAVPLLQERVGITTVGGIVCIVAGRAMLQWIQNSGHGDAKRDAVLARIVETSPRDLLVPALAMAFLGTSFVLVSLGLASFPHPIAGTAVAQSAALVVFVAILVISPTLRGRLQVNDRRALLSFVVAGLAFGGGWVANFFALEIGNAVAIIALVDTFPLFVLVGQYGRARQLPRSYRVVVAIAAIVFGAILIEAF